MSSASPIAPPKDRIALRRRLIDTRKAWADSPQGLAAQAQLTQRLQAVLAQLEPDCLGVYWAIQGEFNPLDLARQALSQRGTRLALPSAHKQPVSMDYLPWDGTEPTVRDACGIPTGAGKPLVPDVILVPCVGFTDEGFRLGYGGGYFDRYLAQHPEVTAIGVAWAHAHIPSAAFQTAAHDQPLMVIVTECSL